MSELIWVGNDLLPRWFVFAVAALVVLALGWRAYMAYSLNQQYGDNR